MAQTHEMAEKDYILGMKYREIAEKYNVSVDTVKKWKLRYKWERDKPVKAIKKPVHNVHKNKKVDKGVQEPEEELSDMEQLFCYHYVRCWNATQAALKSGYSQNKASANVAGCRLLQRPRIKQEIDRLRQLFRQDIHIDIQDFLTFCMKIVGADIGDYVTFGQRQQQVIGMYGPLVDKKTKKPIMETVSYIELGESALLDTSLIAEIKQGKDGISIKLADKKWAWEQLIKYFDWLPDQWQRKVTDEKLGLERRKVELAEKSAGNGDDPEDAPQFADDIGGDDDADS